MRMLSYSSTNQYLNQTTTDSFKAVVKLDLNEFDFVLSLLTDIEQSAGSQSLYGHSFYINAVT